MPPRVPEAVRQAWGDELVAEIVPWLEQIVQEKAVPRDEYRQVLSRLEVLEHDVADIKADVRELRREMNERFDRVSERFDQMNERFDRMGQHFETRLDQMSERILVQTRWLIGTIALFGTILTILMAIAQFTP
ncbi:MAG: hypothetical protein ACETWR_15440 [Anaerolineae bacterium]